MTRVTRLLMLGALLASGLLAFPGPALGSCALPVPIEEAVNTADVVILGTVVETSNGGRWATVAVEEVWRGPDQPASVLVKGGPAGDVATSVDRSFEVGVRYLFTLGLDADGSLLDNACSSTMPWAEAATAIRPADARAPIGGEAAAQPGLDLDGPLGPIVVALVVAAALLAVGLLAAGRRTA